MIYKAAQIEKYLKKTETNIKGFLVYGSNEGLIAEYVRKLISSVSKDLYDPFCVAYLNGADVNTDSGALVAEYNSQSLMGGRRVVVVKDADNNLTKHLKNLLDGSDKNILFSSHVIGNGKKCFKMAKDLNLEGIIAKKIDSNYVCKRSEDWLKIKCYKRQEFVIVGYLTSEKNKILSAILVGYYAGKKLVFAGKVGTGFSLETKKELVKKFNSLKSDKCYLSEDYNIKANWIKPELVAEIKFTEFTKDNILRQPSFVGLREDKEPKLVVMEQENGNKD